MLIGPVFGRELAITPRRTSLYIYRTVYVAGLFLLMCTAWLVLAGTQQIRDLGDMARFGTILFQILAPLQLSLAVFFAALASASAVSLEKDRKTLVLLLMTRMSDRELVLGKLLASLLHVLVMIAAGAPVFMLAVLFGGVSFGQVFRVLLVTTLTAIAAGSLGTVIAFYREKTFQTLALVTMGLVCWLIAWEPVYAGMFGNEFFGISCRDLATGMSPVRAVVSAAGPQSTAIASLGIFQTPVGLYLTTSSLAAFLMSVVAIWGVRRWNPSRELRRRNENTESTQESIWGVEHDINKEKADAAREGHVDSQLRQGLKVNGKTRNVWDNPILWREVCTWAYGRKIMVIRLAYVLFFVAISIAVLATVNDVNASSLNEGSTQIPLIARPMTPLLLVSLVIVNALAVTAITNERDGRSLDLLLVTDLDPPEIIFGKLGGILYVTKEMIVLPILLAVGVWFFGGMTFENLLFLIPGLVVMYIFVAMLGLHCGMTYASSRTAIGVSLGTVFFLFLGVVTCLLMMISFSNFQAQLAPFMAFILGGGVGLYLALGARNPARAIGAASFLLPFATFYAITSFLLQYNLTVFLVTIFTYGFTTAAMMIPALSEFDVAMGRTTTGDD